VICTPKSYPNQHAQDEDSNPAKLHDLKACCLFVDQQLAPKKNLLDVLVAVYKCLSFLFEHEQQNVRSKV
jgi:hypothetical protein